LESTEYVTTSAVLTCRITKNGTSSRGRQAFRHIALHKTIYETQKITKGYLMVWPQPIY